MKPTIRNSENEYDDSYDALLPSDSLLDEDDPAPMESNVKIDAARDPPSVEEHDKMVGTKTYLFVFVCLCLSIVF